MDYSNESDVKFLDFKSKVEELLKDKVLDAIELKRIEIAEKIYSEGLEESVDSSDAKIVNKVKSYVNGLEEVSSDMKKKIISTVLKIKDLSQKSVMIEIMKVMDKLGVEV
jgi:hypothetical protein